MKLPSLDWLQNRTARRYLRSYLLISIIPVILVIAVFCTFTVSTMQTQLEKDMQSQLEQIKNELDANITYMDSSAAHLAQVITSRQAEEDDEEQTMGWLPQQLATYQQNFHLNNTAVYFTRGSVDIYTSEGVQNYESFRREGLWRDQLDMSQFYTKLNLIQGRTLMASRRLDGEAGDYLIYLTPIPNLDVTPQGTAAFLIEKQQIDQLLESYLGDFDGYFLMCDNFYGLAYQYGQADASAAEEVTKFGTAYTPGGSEIQHTIGSESFVIMRSVSSNYGFTYFYAIPTETFEAPVWERVTFYITLGAAIVLLLLIAAYLSTARSFRPILQLADDLLHGNRSQPTQTDLFEQISNEYRSMAAQNDSLQEQLQLQSTLGRQRLLTTLLYGWRGSREKLDKALRQAETTFPYPDFFVMAVRVENNIDPQDLLLTIFDQPWISTQPWIIYLLETSTPHTAALLFNLDRQNEIRQIVADEIVETLQEYSCGSLKIGLGDYRTDPMDIGASYCEALIAMQDSAVTVSLFQKPDTSRENYLCPLTEGKMLQQSLLNGSREMAMELFGQMASEVQAHHPPFHITRCFCFYIVNLLLQIKPTLNASLKEDELTYMAANADLERFIIFAEELIDNICRQVAESRSSDQDQTADEVLSYIRENFSDYSLSVEQLTNRFDLSERVVRQILRDRTGGGLTSYLTTLRMNWIKRQLTETDTPIRELIAQVGYTDVSSFTRKFKLLEGMTPGQYRAVTRTDQPKDGGD